MIVFFLTFCVIFFNFNLAVVLLNLVQFRHGRIILTLEIFGDVYLLLFGGQGSLSRLQPLLLVLFLLGCCLWIFSDCALVGIPEKDRLLLGWLIVDLSFFMAG